jgi:hypothetical protein
MDCVVAACLPAVLLAVVVGCDDCDFQLSLCATFCGHRVVAGRSGGMELHLNAPHGVWYCGGALGSRITEVAAPHVEVARYNVLVVSEILL